MKKILVVDDEQIIRDDISEYLSIIGYKVITAGNGKEGLDLVKSENPDLIITDIIMPEMEGIEFIGKVKKSFKNIPVIAMSGSSFGKKFLDAACLIGAEAKFEKPFDLDKLLKKVESLLE